MKDWQALHRAIVEDLDSDGPRLVLADALQAAGDPRGELIAVQCELARLSCDRVRLATGHSRRVHGGFPVERDWMADVFATGDFQRTHQLRATERRLWSEHGDRWSAGLPQDCVFERGFVAHVDGYLRRDPSPLFDLAPTLESLELELASSCAELIAEPRMRQVKQLRLSLSGPVPDRVALERWLSTLPRLSTLAVDDDATERDFAWCFSRPVVERLEAVALVRPAPRLVESLCVSARRLRHLSLREATTTALDEAADRLEILELDQPVPELAAAVHSLRALRVLRLAARSGTEGIARAIGNLGALQLLDVSHTSFGQSLPQLFSGGLTSLTHLRLHRCGVQDETLAPMLTSPLMQQLQHLDLRRNPITDRSVAGLSAASRLRVLELQYTNLSPTGVDALRAALPETQLYAPVFR